MGLNPYAVCRDLESLPQAKPLAVRVHVADKGGWFAVMPSNYPNATKGRYMVVCLSDSGDAETVMAGVPLHKAYEVLRAIPYRK